jgi:hypothetical protein
MRAAALDGVALTAFRLENFGSFRAHLAYENSGKTQRAATASRCVVLLLRSRGEESAAAVLGLMGEPAIAGRFVVSGALAQRSNQVRQLTFVPRPLIAQNEAIRRRCEGKKPLRRSRVLCARPIGRLIVTP